MPKLNDLSGMRFGRLTVVARDNSVRHKTKWFCLCDCGNTISVYAYSLKNGNTKSCGCLQRQVASVLNTTHGASSNSRLYSIWLNMKNRCFNIHHRDYCRYGGRGISVCQEWADSFVVFRDWSMSNGYDDTKTIDRIDNNQNYTPSNCRWTTPTVQANNKRNNHLLEYNGEIRTISEWAKELNIRPGVIFDRINRLGWSIEDALNKRTKE